MHLPFHFIYFFFTRLWHLLDVSAVAGHGAGHAGLLSSLMILFGTNFTAIFAKFLRLFVPHQTTMSLERMRTTKTKIILIVAVALHIYIYLIL